MREVFAGARYGDHRLVYGLVGLVTLSLSLLGCSAVSKTTTTTMPTPTPTPAPAPTPAPSPSQPTYPSTPPVSVTGRAGLLQHFDGERTGLPGQYVLRQSARLGLGRDRYGVSNGLRFERRSLQRMAGRDEPDCELITTSISRLIVNGEAKPSQIVSHNIRSDETPQAYEKIRQDGSIIFHDPSRTASGLG